MPTVYTRASLNARVAKWQTQQTQNLPGRKPRVGSSPTSGTKTETMMRLMRGLTLIFSLSLSLSVVFADEDPRNSPEQHASRRNYVFTPTHSLSADDLAELHA